MKLRIELQALLLALPCCLQTGQFTPEAQSLGWQCFEKLLQIYLRANTMRELTPVMRELDVKLRDVESGELGEAAKHQVMQSICRTLRAYLRTEYGLKEKNYINRYTEARRHECQNSY